MVAAAISTGWCDGGGGSGGGGSSSSSSSSSWRRNRPRPSSAGAAPIARRLRPHRTASALRALERWGDACAVASGASRASRASAACGVEQAFAACCVGVGGVRVARRRPRPTLLHCVVGTQAPAEAGLGAPSPARPLPSGRSYGPRRFTSAAQLAPVRTGTPWSVPAALRVRRVRLVRHRLRGEMHHALHAMHAAMRTKRARCRDRPLPLRLPPPSRCVLCALRRPFACVL